MKDNQGNTAVDDIDLNVYQNIFRFCFYDNDSLPFTWAATILVPVARQELLDDQAAGFGDFTLGLAGWAVNKPDIGLYLAPMLYIDIPFGEYDVNKTANLGANAWKFRPTLLFAKYWDTVITEATLRYNIYTENEAIDTTAGNEWSFDALVGYKFKPNLIGSALFNAVWGDDMEVNGRTIDGTGIQKYKAGASLTMFSLTNKKLPSVVVEYLKDFQVENAPEGNTLLIRLCWKIF